MLSWIKSEINDLTWLGIFIFILVGSEKKKSFLPDDGETIIQMEIERLKTFKDHPFKVQDDSDMKLLKESIEKYGILNPLIVLVGIKIIIAMAITRKNIGQNVEKEKSRRKEC